MRKTLLSSLSLVAVGFISCQNKNTDPASSGPPYFPKVKTIIGINCMGCHSSSGSWTGRPVAFDTDAEIVAAANNIKTAVAGPWTPMVKKMPQGGVLTKGDIDIIVAWVNAGGQSSN